MGLTAVSLAILIALLVVIVILYRFRDPHRYNARKCVRETTGFGEPHDKIE